MIAKFLTLGILTFWLNGCLTFNIDSEANRLKFTIGQQSNTSFFGYSIAFFGTQANARLIIGAPRLNNRDGAIFGCPVNGNDHTCSQLTTQNQTSTNIRDKGSPGELLGISVSTTGDSISACAQFTRFKSIRCVNDTHPSRLCIQDRNYFLGRCPVLNQNFNFQYSSVPCLDANNLPHNTNYGLCMLGFSHSAFNKDSKLYQFISAPGTGQFNGAVVAMENGVKISRFMNKVVLNDDKTFHPISVPVQNYTERVSMLGYSTAKGNFTGDSMPGLAAGAPRENKFKGEVLIYRYVLNPTRTQTTTIQDSTLSLVSTISNPVKSKGGISFFGAALAAIDINNDTLDDLVVGAPLFSNIVGNRIGQDEGKAFVFINNGNGQFTHEPTMTLEGLNQERSRFGTTIVNIGDINNDGFDDIAVGAPWGGTDGNGVVFIYNVRNGKLMNTPSQILNSPEKSGDFGFSISAAKVNTKVYPVLGVGAPKSGRVFLFRAKTIITLKDNVRVNRTSIPTDQSNCQFKGKNYQCIKFDPDLQDISTNAPVKFDVQITIKADISRTSLATRALIYDNKTNSLVEVLVRNITVNRGGKVPFEQIIFLSIDKTTDFQAPVNFTTSYRTVDTFNNCEDGPCAILDQYGALNGHVSVKYLRQCGPDDRCQYDLVIKSAEITVIRGTSSAGNLLLVGSFNNEIKLTTKVTNRVESAYLSKMSINYHEDFGVLQVSVNTRNVIVEYDDVNVNGTGRIVRFLLDNPILAGETVDVEVKFILHSLTRPKFTEYPFFLSVNATDIDIDVNETNNIMTTFAHMGIQSCVTLALDQKGSKVSEAPLVRYDHLQSPIQNPTTPDEVGPKIEYALLIQNNGRVPIDNISIDITVVEKVVDKVSTQNVVFVYELSVGGRKCEPNRIDPNNLIKNNNGNGDNSTILVRKRRDSEVVAGVRPPTLNCDNGVCTRFTCRNIINLPVNGLERLKLSLSVYLEALQKFQSDKMIVDIKTNFHGEFGSVTRQQSNCDANMILQQPFARLQEKKTKKNKVEWWIILVAVVGALILLAIFCVILYRIGFFKRHRPEDAEPLHSSHHIESYQQKSHNRSNGYDSE